MTFFDRLMKFLAQFPTAQGIWLSVLLLFLLGILLTLGRRLEPALKLERIGIPIALLVGFAALLIGPYGPIPLLKESVTDVWVRLPTPLLTLVFATLMLGRPLPSIKGLLKPVFSQALLGLLLGFGQYLFGGLVVLFVLTPLLGVDPLMGCLIEVGFEGGHGAAAVMGESFKRLGFQAGLDLGMAMATVGLLSSTLIGSALVVIGRWSGWMVKNNQDVSISETEPEESISVIEQFNLLLINLALAGAAVLLGVLMLTFLRSISSFFGDIFHQVISVFPVFPLALLGSFLIRFSMEKIDKTEFVSQLLQREIGTISTDLLIATAIASLNIPLLVNDWVPILVLSVTGLTWNLFGMLLSRYIFSEEWFERSIAEFGNATGVAASGLLLLRLADPLNLTRTLPVFSMKQLLLQPLLSGGLITVVAPLIVLKVGLIEWTEICGVITLVAISLAFVIQRYPVENPL